jgi:UDP-glucuronate 4-epimerase
MTVLVTGVAGFIGFHVAAALLARGERVVGVDNLNDYYDVALKEARLAELEDRPGFEFHYLDLADRRTTDAVLARHPDVDRVVHLAAQAGVRHSLVDPHIYVRSNVEGQLVVLEACRRLKHLRHLVYASSSSVYGGSARLPFALDDPVDRPLSLYGATKRTAELMAMTYSHLFALPATGLRFFTVYGPWGRPDMAAYIFTRAILAGQPIRLFNDGAMKRDFTYIDDIVGGVLAALDRPPAAGGGDRPHRLYNLGNSRSEPLTRFVAVLERACGRTATIEHAPMQPGDVTETFADIAAATRDLGFQPATAIDEGLPRFVAWYRAYHRV